MKLFILILLSLCILPLMSIATANVNSDVFYVLIQIIQRDPTGILIGYIESENASVTTIFEMGPLLDSLAAEQGSQFFELDGKNVELIRHMTDLGTDPSGLLSTVSFNVILNENSYTMVSLAHDGMRLNPDEQVTVIWTFLRTV